MSDLQFPEWIDNTMLKAMRRCPKYLEHRYIQGLRPVDEVVSIDLHFGGCFAKGIEMSRRSFFEKGNCAAQAIEDGHAAASAAWSAQTILVPTRSNKTFGNLMDALSYYWRTWPLGDDGLTPVEGGIEATFEVPLPITHPHTHKPLHYAGRCDMFARNEVGGYVLVDEKTTGTFSDAWLGQWDMDPQMTGYIWAHRMYGTELPHALIRGISVTKAEISHTLVPVFRTDWQVKLWYRQMLRDVQRMLTLFHEGKFDYAMGSACTAYGRLCEFSRLCTTPNAQQFVETSFVVDFWNPLKRDAQKAD